MTRDEQIAWIKQNVPEMENAFITDLEGLYDDRPDIKQQITDSIELKKIFDSRPDFEKYSITNPDGTLKSQFNVNAKPYIDQIQGVKMDDAGYKAFQQKALWDSSKQGDSPWMKLMKEQSELQRQDAAQTLSAQQAGAAAQARSQLAMRGGLSGGAAVSLARQGARDLSRGQQGLARQNLTNLSNLGIQDEQMRTNMLSQLPGFEAQRFSANLGQAQSAAQMGLQSDQWNMGNAIRDMGTRGQFDMDAWKQRMEAEGAYRNARATEKAGKGCCFIFLEARYGNGTMDAVVRRFRDEHMTARNRRGYYKLAEVLVPAMRQSKVAKFLVRTLMTDPMVSYGKYFYGQGKIGKLFAPVAKFWLKAFDFLGQEHPFLRENGELI